MYTRIYVHMYICEYVLVFMCSSVITSNVYVNYYRRGRAYVRILYRLVNIKHIEISTQRITQSVDKAILFYYSVAMYVTVSGLKMEALYFSETLV
jgi:hypothetical protein